MDGWNEKTEYDIIIRINTHAEVSILQTDQSVIAQLYKILTS